MHLDDNTAPDLPALPEGRFNSPSEFSALIRLAFAAAAVRGWREITLSDSNFEDWPLGELAVAQRSADLAQRDWRPVVQRHRSHAQSFASEADNLIR